MSINDKSLKDEMPQSPSEISQESSEATTNVSSEISALTEQLKKLIEKLDVPKRKDTWDILSVLTAFMGTVIVSLISLYLTQSYQRLEAERAALFNQLQIENQRAQIRVEELKAITALAPLLASSDAGTKETGRQLLQAVQETGTLDTAPNLSVRATQSPLNPRASLLDHFAKIVLSSSAPASERVAAIQQIGKIATESSTAPSERERAADIAAQVIASEEIPPEVRQAAAEVIAKIKRVTAAEVQNMISSEPVTRQITEVILHHTATPASAYNGEQTILNIAKFQVTKFNWSRVSWHYAIAPDGSIWLGSPLNQPANHAKTHNPMSVSVLLIMNGEKEMPTDAQRTSLAIVLRALFARLKLDASANSPEGSGFHFHRDYGPGTCPGSLLSKEMVFGWL